MNNDPKHGMECSEFEALLAEALDDSLAAGRRPAFDAHRLSCEVCGPMWTEVKDGMMMVRGLAELEPPKNLVHNILAATSRQAASAEAVSEEAKLSWLERLQRSMRPALVGLRHSRFAMSFAMAFFSLSITLTLAGVKVTDVANMVGHPTMLKKNVVLGFTHVEARVTSYYENLRIVYQVQARVREFKKNATTPAEGTNNNGTRQQNRKSEPNDGGRPQKYEHYSRERDGSVIAQTYIRHEGAQI